MPNGTGTQAASSVETPSGIFQAKASGTARRSACEPSRPTVTTRSPDREAAHVGSHLGHDPGALVAHDVRHAWPVRRPAG